MDVSAFTMNVYGELNGGYTKVFRSCVGQCLPKFDGIASKAMGHLEQCFIENSRLLGITDVVLACSLTATVMALAYTIFQCFDDSKENRELENTSRAVEKYNQRVDAALGRSFRNWMIVGGLSLVAAVAVAARTYFELSLASSMTKGLNDHKALSRFAKHSWPFKVYSSIAQKYFDELSSGRGRIEMGILECVCRERTI